MLQFNVTCVNRVILLSYCCIILSACYYGKVTLFEGASVVKAKKTRPVPALLHEISVPISPFKGAKNDSVSNIPVHRNANENTYDTTTHHSGIIQSPEFEVNCRIFNHYAYSIITSWHLLVP